MTHPASRPLRAVPPAPAPAGLEPGASAELAWEELPAEMWSLPAAIATSAFAELHTSLVAGLRRDARHLPTGTLQAMQLERVVYYYIYIRYCDANGWPSPREKAAVYSLWRQLSADFNSVVYGNKISPEQLHAIVSTHTAKIVASVLRGLPREQSAPLYEKFAAVIDAPDAG